MKMVAGYGRLMLVLVRSPDSLWLELYQLSGRVRKATFVCIYLIKKRASFTMNYGNCGKPKELGWHLGALKNFLHGPEGPKAPRAVVALNIPDCPNSIRADIFNYEELPSSSYSIFNF